MTTPDPKDGPTQAQIEAGKAIYRRHCIRHNHRFDWEQAAQSMWTDYAIAALTAAAEAGKQEFNPDALDRLRAEGKKAAIDRTNATIERCAQVLKKRRDNLLKDGTGPTLLIAESMKGDIAAIRAMKQL